MPSRRRTRWTTRLAMLGGLLLGLALLYGMRPPPPSPTVRTARVAPKAAPTAPDLRPTPRRSAHAPVLEEAPSPDEDDEAAIEPMDTGEMDFGLANIQVRYEDDDGYVIDDAWGGLRGCSVEAFERTEDGFTATVVAGDICEAAAYRRDGLLSVRSDFLEFEAVDGLVATLVFPAGRTGGIGVQFQPVDGGMMVVAVMPGTPASLAGLTPGDVIVGVQGLDAADLESQDFIDEMTGPEGSDVEFEIEFDADTGLTRSSVTLTRAFLSG